jgi:tagatose-6-phosphate ketose/aldose isomerase
VSTILGIEGEQLQRRGGLWTAREIAQQPGIWPEVIACVQRQGGATFVRQQLATPGLRVLLTGAGSSAFIGDCLAPAIVRRHGMRACAVATTDLVAGPERLLQPDAPTLMVHFARSGDSPESTAALQLADRLLGDCRHFVVTCNGAGALSELARRRESKAQLLVLPEAAHDRAFAMTSSFTSMLLAASHAFGLVEQAPTRVAAEILQRAPKLAERLVAQRFQRVVYLGSNEWKGLAHEAALKLLELTDGRVIGLHDTPLGFRHGPKTVVDANTLVVLFVSLDAHARRYDLDLLRELRHDGRAGRVLALAANGEGLEGAEDDILFEDPAQRDDVAALPAMALLPQVFALHQSLALGLAPDNPCDSGTVNRVVQGVTIYPYTGKDRRNVHRH